MSELASEIRDHTDEIVQRWHDAWREREKPHHDLSEAALKDALPQQLRVIADQLADLERATPPRELWRRVPERLDPEHRIAQEVGIEEVVQEYGLAVQVVRDWIEERDVEVSFEEYSYLYQALFELAAESVRRYAAREAELVTDARAEYLAGVMHQLRTPLSALALTIELLGADEPRPPSSVELARLRRNARRITTLVEGVLRLERYRPRELPVHPEEVQPARILDEIVSDHEREAARKGLRFEVRVDRSLRMTVDPELLTDCIGNLVHNAVKYTAQGEVRIELEAKASDVVFRIRDTGPGIDEETRSKLFDRIQPGKAGGAGLGLRIARHAAQAMGGRIELESEVGRGSTFCVTLPRDVPPREG